MISKTKEAPPTSNRFEQAGNAAEEQMAFYLRRAFGDAPDVFVFNDLRLMHGDDAAQIDHLVFHRFGFFIVESKSISGQVIINEHGDWIRVRGRHREGMPSPILQACRQGEFLRKLLGKHKEALRDKRILGKVQPGFKHCPIAVCAAISDKSIIKRENTNPPEVCKADQVCDRILAEIKRHHKASGLLSKLDGDYGLWSLTPVEMERIVAFLLDRHTPLRSEGRAAPAQPATPAPAGQQAAVSKSTGPRPAPPATCKHCGNNDLVATYGKYGYYFKCRACQGNTPIDYACRQCGKKGRIRKQGPEFSRVCAACGAEELVWANPA